MIRRELHHTARRTWLIPLSEAPSWVRIPVPMHIKSILTGIHAMPPAPRASLSTLKVYEEWLEPSPGPGKPNASTLAALCNLGLLGSQG